MVSYRTFLLGILFILLACKAKIQQRFHITVGDQNKIGEINPLWNDLWEFKTQQRQGFKME